jgi:uncharacterized protein YjdB
MNYLFKLTRRLAHARAHVALILIALAACTKDAGPVTAPAIPPALPSASDNTVASVVITPASVSGNLGETGQFTATARNAAGTIISGQAIVWASTDPTLVAVTTSGLVTAVGVGATTVTATASGITGQAQVTVAGDAVSTITVAPSEMSGKIGQVTQFRATLMGASGNAVSGRPVIWTSDAPTVATVDSTGKATQVGLGSATITAASAGKSGAGRVVVAASTAQVPGTVSDLAVIAAEDTSAVLGFTQVSDGTDQPAKYIVQYSLAPISSNTAAPVAQGTCAAPVEGTALSGPLTCTALGLSPATTYNFQVISYRGTIGVDAVLGAPSNVSSTTTARRVANVSVAPNLATASVGQTVQFTATASDGSGSPVVGRTVSWVSGNPGVATVNANGMATAVGAGSTNVIAMVGGKTGQASLTIAPPPVAASAATVSVSPAALGLTVGTTQQLAATVLDASGNVLTGQAIAWATSNGAVVTVSVNGVATAVAAGSANITATVSGKTGAASVTVSSPPPPPPAQVASITVSPVATSILVGAAQQLTATAKDASGNVMAGQTIGWSTSDASVASVNANGVVTGLGAGSVTITASSAGKTGTSSVTVTAPVTANPGTVTDLSVSATTDNSATLSFTQVNNGLGQPATYDIRYTLSPIGYGWGQATSVANGTCTSPLSGTDITGTLSCTVLGLQPGTTYDFQIVAYRANAGVNYFGNLSSPATASTTGSKPVVVASVKVAPVSALIAVGATKQLTATVKDAAGKVLAGQAVTWTSANQAVATVSASGLVSAVAAGSATITGASGGKSGSASVTVTAPPPPPVTVASVTLTPATLLVQTGTPQQLTATVKDGNGNVMAGQTIAWATSDGTVAAVSPSGMVSGLAAGSVTITASNGGKTGTAGVTVSVPAVANPGTVADLAVSATTDTSATLTFTQVSDGLGQPATFDIRYALAPIGFGWGQAASVASGTCASPLSGTGISGVRSTRIFMAAFPTSRLARRRHRRPELQRRCRWHLRRQRLGLVRRSS